MGQLVETLHGLGMEVVAEGVDDRARLKVLLGLGVDLVQGMLLAEPLPASELGGLPTRVSAA